MQNIKLFYFILKNRYQHIFIIFFSFIPIQDLRKSTIKSEKARPRKSITQYVPADFAKVLAYNKFLFPICNFIKNTLIYKAQSYRANFLERWCKKFLIQNFFTHLFKYWTYSLNGLLGLYGFFLILYLLEIKQMGFFL